MSLISLWNLVLILSLSLLLFLQQKSGLNRNSVEELLISKGDPVQLCSTERVAVSTIRSLSHFGQGDENRSVICSFRYNSWDS